MESNDASAIPQRDWDVVFRLLQEGDEDAFDSIFREFYPKLVAFAQGYGGLSIEQAEDLLGEVFTWIWQYRAEITVKSSFEAYIYGAVRNKLLNDKRNRKQRYEKLRRLGVGLSEELLGRQPSIHIDMETKEIKRELIRCVMTLSEMQRLIITLRWAKQWNWDRIAEVVGITPASAQMKHTRALRLIRAIFDGQIRD